jgi:hypothetical protein
VLLETDGDLAVGEFGIATRVAQPEELPVRPRLPEPVPVAAPASAATVGVPEAAPTVIYRPDPVPEPPREVVTLTVDGRTVPLNADRVAVGRSRECDVRIDDGNVSRRHAELTRGGDGGWSIVDLGSTNGTEVNGRRVSRRTQLEDGDRIVIGGSELVFAREASSA